MTKRRLAVMFQVWLDDKGHAEPGQAVYSFEQMHEAFVLGFRAGLREFAWWKDGEQFVGTRDTTLKSALEETEK